MALPPTAERGSHGFLRAGRKKPEALAPICPTDPIRQGRAPGGSLGALLRQEVTRRGKPSLPCKRDGREQEGPHTRFKGLKNERVCRFKFVDLHIHRSQ